MSAGRELSVVDRVERRLANPRPLTAEEIAAFVAALEAAGVEPADVARLRQDLEQHGHTEVRRIWR